MARLALEVAGIFRSATAPVRQALFCATRRWLFTAITVHFTPSPMPQPTTRAPTIGSNTPPIASHDRYDTIQISIEQQRAITTLASSFPRLPPLRLVQRLPMQLRQTWNVSAWAGDGHS